MVEAVLWARLGSALDVVCGVIEWTADGDSVAGFGPWRRFFVVVGALPGAAMIVAGYEVDERSNHDPSLFYAGGSVLAGVGVIAGSILAFETSSHPNVRVDAGLGSLSVRGRFD